MTYSVSDLKQAAYNAGFRGTALVTAVAVSLAENSSRDEHAVNVNSNGSRDLGAWQINTVHADMIAQTGDPFDLQANARMAFNVYKDAGRSFSPWVQYKNGAYKPNLARAQKPKVTAGDGSTPLGGGLLGASASGDATGQEDESTVFNYLTGQWNPVTGMSWKENLNVVLGTISDSEFWRRAGMVAAGILIVIVAVVLMIGGNKVSTLAKVAA